MVVAQDQANGTQDTKSTQGVDNQDSADQGQSNGANGESGGDTPKLFKMPDGREMSADDLYKEHTEKLLPEFTRRSQKLKEFERKESEAKQQAGDAARKQVEDNDLLKNVSPDVKEAIMKIVEPQIKQALQAKEQESLQVQKEKAFENELGDLEKKWDGKNGLPKFDRAKVISAMQDPNNRIFDPESKFRQMHEKEFTDHLIESALKKGKGGLKTEMTGSNQDRKPDAHTPKTFSEASSSFLQRLKNE